MGIVNTNDIITATHIVNTDIQDEELQLSSALNILRSLINYKVANPQEYADISTENDAIHYILSIEEIVSIIQQQEDNIENNDEDGPAPPKISISVTLSSQEDSSLSTQDQLAVLQQLTHELNIIDSSESSETESETDNDNEYDPDQERRHLHWEAFLPS
ncbi:9715_t:CDS:2 [Ambispora leptoticha]|uniref:9715_t:CDS:1 n=1 Tax=Ambispora leptoticha TaxID=144679 RepID=A0A9N9AV21_9GLOM|nr:9715_t:CDS:2 [Ambispora leptoticha]